MEKIAEAGVGFPSLTGHIDTTMPAGQMARQTGILGVEAKLIPRDFYRGMGFRADEFWISDSRTLNREGRLRQVTVEIERAGRQLLYRQVNKGPRRVES